MISKYNFIQILVRVTLILINCFVLAFLFYNSQSYIIIVHLFLLVILQSCLLSRYLNKSNKKIQSFLESYINNDPIQLSLGKAGDVYSKKIFDQLERINKKVKEAEKKLSKQLVYTNAVSKNIPGGLITVIDEDRIDLYSNSVLDLLNKRTLNSLNDFSEYPDLLQSLKNLKPGEKKIERINTEDGFKVLSLSCSEIKSENTNTRIITFENIKSELDDQEIQSWQKLIRVLTHEMMNSFSPLISTNETLGMLLKSIEFSNGKVINSEDLVRISKLEKGIEVINERSKGITGFIEKYRQLAKLPKPVCNQVSVKKLIEETVLMHEESISRTKIKCTTDVNPSDLKIVVDEQLIMQVLINLFKNSVEALEEIEEPQIYLSAKLNNENKVIVSICDNGCGIENDDLSEIFIPFFTTKKGGSGVGLSLSKQIMNLHKGELNVNQKEYKTEFILIF